MTKVSKKALIQLLKTYSEKKYDWYMLDLIEIDLKINPSKLTRYSKKAIRNDFFGTVIIKSSEF